MANQYQSKQYGFTLVELLVVIAIISILAGLLLPALEESLAQARSIDCMNSLKQVGMAFNMYMDEFGGFNPALAKDPPNVNGLKARCWWGMLGYCGYAGGITVSPTNGAYGRYGIFQCAAETGSRYGLDTTMDNGDAEEGMTLYDAYRCGNSYKVTMEIAKEDGIHSVVGNPTHVVFRCGKPSQAILCMDARDGCTQSWTWQYFDYYELRERFYLNSGYPEYVRYAFRHSGRANVMYVDGHVGSRLHQYEGGEPITLPSMFD